MQVPDLRHPGYTPRRTGGLASYERVLARAGFTPVAGIDEAGRGACAGPLVVAAVALNPAKLSRLSLIADSKALTAAAREQAYDEVMSVALAWHVIVIPSTEIDSCGLHVCNLAGMRRALAGLACQPAYVITDGFPVRGLGVPALAMWKGDEVAACVAAASVVAKVTRDRMMRELHTRYPRYDFARHKGYATRGHMKALNAHGPCPEHRVSFVNVGSLLAEAGGRLAAEVDDQLTVTVTVTGGGGRFGGAGDGSRGGVGGGSSGIIGDGRPGALEAAQPGVLDDGAPGALRAAAPGAAQFEVLGDGGPGVLAENQPGALAENQPGALAEDQPGALAENQPGTGPEGLLDGEVGGPAMVSPGVRDAVLSGGLTGADFAGAGSVSASLAGTNLGDAGPDDGPGDDGATDGVCGGGGMDGGSQGDAAARRPGAAYGARPDREEVLVEVGRLPLADADQEN